MREIAAYVRAVLDVKFRYFEPNRALRGALAGLSRLSVRKPARSASAT